MLRKALWLAVAGVMGLTCWAGVSRSARTADAIGLGEAKAPAFVHVVILNVKKDAPEGEADALIADANDMLRSIPTVRDIRAGKPADMPVTGPGKKDFSVGLLVLFDDQEGLKTYSNHPMHLKYVQKHLKYLDTDKLMVFDFVNPKH
jgi:hypothetical protein